MVQVYHLFFYTGRMPFVLIAGIIFFSLILLKATDLLVVHLKALAEKTHLGDYLLSTVIVGLATSLPELTVAVTSSLAGAPNSWNYKGNILFNKFSSVNTTHKNS